MTDDSIMMPEHLAQAQLWSSFRNLMPHMSTIKDETLELSQNPGLPKRPRKEQGHKGSGKELERAQAELDQDALRMMARLLIQQDHELQSLRRESTFIFFFDNRDKAGGLKCLLDSAEKWRAEMQKDPKPQQWHPLRQRLLQDLMNLLLTRLNELGSAEPQSDLLKAAQQNLILLEDHSCPCLEWCPTKQTLVVSKRQPLSLRKLVQMVQELLELMTSETLVSAFHALPSKGNTSTWKLQLSLRADQEYWLFRSLCHSAMWILLAASLKSHSLHQSTLAGQLAEHLQLFPKKGKGRGKGAKSTP